MPYSLSSPAKSTPLANSLSHKQRLRVAEQLFPDTRISLGEVDGVACTVFHQKNGTDLAEPSLQRPPDGWRLLATNHRQATEAELRLLFLQPAPGAKSVCLRGFTNLTPSFMEQLALARPCLTKIDLRGTRSTYDLIKAYLKSHGSTTETQSPTTQLHEHHQTNRNNRDMLIIKIEGSDLTPEQHHQLDIAYPHIALINSNSTLDASGSSLSLNQIQQK